MSETKSKPSNLIPLPSKGAWGEGKRLAADAASSCVVVVNKGSGTVKELWNEMYKRRLLSELRKGGWEPVLEEVEGAQIEAVVVNAIQDKVGAVISAGGDGTTSGIAALLKGTGIPLGVLPFGTLNLAPRYLDTPMDPIRAAGSIKPSSQTPMDALEIGDRLCLCVAIIGVYPEILQSEEEYHGRRWWSKITRYGGGFVRSFLSAKSMRIKVLDGSGATTCLKTRMMILVPGRFKDSAGALPEKESLNCGGCTLLVSKHRSGWSLFKAATRFLSGACESDPELKIRHRDIVEVDIAGKDRVLSAIDGELVELEVPIKFGNSGGTLLVLRPDAD